MKVDTTINLTDIMKFAVVIVAAAFTLHTTNAQTRADVAVNAQDIAALELKTEKVVEAFNGLAVELAKVTTQLELTFANPSKFDTLPTRAVQTP